MFERRWLGKTGEGIEEKLYRKVIGWVGLLMRDNG